MPHSFLLMGFCISQAPLRHQKRTGRAPTPAVINSEVSLQCKMHQGGILGAPKSPHLHTLAPVLISCGNLHFQVPQGGREEEPENAPSPADLNSEVSL
jgi:hypothetical protein